MTWPVHEHLLSVPEAAAAVPADHGRAAVAIVLRAGEPGPEVLLMVRVEDERDPWSGQVSLPGGHAEEADADPAATAARETREEVGVDLHHGATLGGALEPIQARVGGRLLSTTIVPVVFLHHGQAEIALGPEAAAAFWLPLRSAAAGELDGVHLRPPGSVPLQMPAWHFEERVVWGLTHRILRDFLCRAWTALGIPGPDLTQP